jgi:hypothetical protein
MKTTLTPETLAALHAEGRAQAACSRFVDPVAVSRCRRVLTQRGEEWAASVLLRDISRRSPLRASLPYLDTGEPEILVLADAAEWKALSKDVAE